MSGVVVTTPDRRQYRYLDADSYDNADNGVLDIMDKEGLYLATFNQHEWARVEYVADSKRVAE